MMTMLQRGNDMSEYRNRWITVRAFALAVAVLLSLVGQRAMGQATSGVTGVVTDQSGAVIAGVQVTLRNPATSFEVSTATNRDGSYQFRLVPPANGYQLTFTKSSFKTLTLETLELGVGVTETRDVGLVVGATQEHVEVTVPVSYTHLDVYKRQHPSRRG